ncbi:MAG: hypothetical protein ABI330_19050, partial [Caldimonas sp.]
MTLSGADHEKFNASNDDDTPAVGAGTQAFQSDLLPAFAGGQIRTRRDCIAIRRSSARYLAEHPQAVLDFLLAVSQHDIAL